MKETVFIILTAFLWINFSPTYLLSQTEGQTSQLYLIAEFIIKPSLVGSYKAVAKEFLYSSYESQER